MEYLYLDKSAMYLWSLPQVVPVLNEYDALTVCERCDGKADIRCVLGNLLRGVDEGKIERQAFLAQHSISVDIAVRLGRVIKVLKAALGLSDR